MYVCVFLVIRIVTLGATIQQYFTFFFQVKAYIYHLFWNYGMHSHQKGFLIFVAFIYSFSNVT